MVLCGALTACSGMNQDPLAKKPQALNDVVEKPTLPPVVTPVASDAIRIDTVDFINFDEGQTSEFQISARVLLPDYEFEIEIDNPQDFPGATFDPASGKFSWTPQGVLVGGELKTDRLLMVRVTAEKPNAAVLMGTKAVRIQINRIFNDPKIVSVLAPTAGIREGSIEYITLKVNDMDAVSGDQGTWPRLVFSNPAGVENGIAGFMHVDRVLALPNNDFEFKIGVDLRKSDIVRTSEVFKADFRVASRFNKISDVESFSIRVKNLLGKAQTTWTEKAEYEGGLKVDNQFMIFEPRGEGDILSVTFKRLPQGARAQCNRKEKWMWSCQLQWLSPASNVTQEIDFEAEVRMTNQDNFFDPQEFTQTFTYRLALRPKAPFAPEGGIR